MADRLPREMGYSKAISPAGRIDAWAQRVDASMPRY